MDVEDVAVVMRGGSRGGEGQGDGVVQAVPLLNCWACSHASLDQQMH